MEEVSLQDLKEGMSIEVQAIRETTKKFRAVDKTTGQLEKDISSAHVFVIRGLLNGNEMQMPLTEGTAMHSEFLDYCTENNIRTPADGLNLKFTVGIVKSRSSRYSYPVFQEIYGKSYDSLFE